MHPKAFPLETLSALAIGQRLRACAPVAGALPDATIVVPVNAQGDLENISRLLSDICGYTGSHRLEVRLVVNNFPEDHPPAAIEDLRAMGIEVEAIANVRRPGEAVGFTARIPGVRAARSEAVLLFDADCRIANVTALVDWYVEQFRSGAAAAYTRVEYYDYQKALSLQLRFAVHHTARWIKRTVLRVPTTRGSNYAVRRSTMLELYDQGMLADEMNVGPTFQAKGGRVVYSGSSQLIVYTSGRMFRPGWRRILPYFTYRLFYNLRVLPVRAGVAKVTGREQDPVRRYVNNRPAMEQGKSP